MQYLLDTCAVLFIAQDTKDLSDTARSKLIAAGAGEIAVCSLSVGEIACLVERKRLALKAHWRSWWTELLETTGWNCLAPTSEVVAEAYSLPEPIHRDPVDRMLIATARSMNLTLVTTDAKILQYPHVKSLR